MYLISRSANLTMPLRDRQVEYTPKGDVARVKPAVAVKFQHSGSVPDWARASVSQLPGWGNGIGLNEDPFTRCGSLDTELEAKAQGWDEETLAFVEQALRDASSNGVEYVIADKPRVAKPWPAYDKIDGDEDEAAFTISKKVVEDEWDPRAVLAYESENANRALVVEVLEYLIADQDEDVIGVITA